MFNKLLFRVSRSVVEVIRVIYHKKDEVMEGTGRELLPESERKE